MLSWLTRREGGYGVLGCLLGEWRGNVMVFRKGGKKEGGRRNGEREKVRKRAGDWKEREWEWERKSERENERSWVTGREKTILTCSLFVQSTQLCLQTLCTSTGFSSFGLFHKLFLLTSQNLMLRMEYQRGKALWSPTLIYTITGQHQLSITLYTPCLHKINVTSHLPNMVWTGYIMHYKVSRRLCKSDLINIHYKLCFGLSRHTCRLPAPMHQYIKPCFPTTECYGVYYHPLNWKTS